MRTVIRKLESTSIATVCRATLLPTVVFLTTVGVVASAAADQPAPPEKGARADFLKRYATIESKVMSIAEAMTDAQFEWSPGEGVFSLREAYLHVATTHYRLASFMGAPIPEGLDLEALEKTRGKVATIKVLAASYAHVRGAITRLTDADLDKAVKVWGKDSTVRFAVILAVAHSAEHLGQAIAYARMQGVVPPWSKPAPAKKPASGK